jgi:CRP-like cAMP-binding protein
MAANLRSFEDEQQILSIASKNYLLRDLLTSEAVANQLVPALRPVSLGPNQVLYEQGDRIDHLYFPLDCVVSILGIMEDGTTVETAMVGREGLIDISAILGSGTSRQWTWVAISGEALQLETKVLDQVCVSNESAMKALLHSYRSLVTQMSQRCICNTRHTIHERLCCWLLMIHDRVGGQNLRLTQETIASRVGARRAGITVAAGMLQGVGAIEYRRGHLHIIDREVLEEMVCECYSVLKTDFDSLGPQD